MQAVGVLSLIIKIMLRLEGFKIPNDLREGEVWHITNQSNYLVLDGMVCEEEGERVVRSFIVNNGELSPL